MKHFFAMNPAAGTGKQDSIRQRITEAARQSGIECEMHRTAAPGEASLWAKRMCEAHPGEALRFYAVGGDGTLNEVLNGIYGFANAQLACVPTGSGNDFIRNFYAEGAGGGEGRRSKARFLDIAAQMAGEARPVDVMRYSIGGEARYALNMVNFGFDANVVEHMARFKRTGLLRGTAAYVAGVLWELGAYRMARVRVSVDGSEPKDFPLLLAGVGGGRFSGGGFDGMPSAKVDDRLLDMMVVSPITRGLFLSLVGKYHDGEHVDELEHRHKLHMWSGARVDITPVGTVNVAIDGETLSLAEGMRIELAERQIGFVVP